MKAMKKLISLLLALAMVMALGVVTASAASDGSVTVRNAISGEKYNIYKVFDLTYSGTNQAVPGTGTTPSSFAGKVAYTYQKDTSSADDKLYTALTAGDSPFTLTETATTATDNVYTVTLKTGKTEQDIATFLSSNQSNLKSAGDPKIADNTKEVKWENLPYGYYYITSSVGATVTIDSTLKDVVVEDKNSLPTHEKKEAVGTKPSAANGYDKDAVDVQVGDTIWYQVEVTIGKGTDKGIIISDTMSDGLTLQTGIKVFNGDSTTPLTVETDYTLDTNPGGDKTFSLTLKADYVKTLSENDKIYIRYSATVNEKAVTDTDATVETNTSSLKYSEQPEVTDEVTATTYKFQLNKVDGDGAALLGATFELYRGTDTSDATKKVNFMTVKVGSATDPAIIRVANDSDTDKYTQINLSDAGLKSTKVIIQGLGKESYTLREVTPPAGYNAAGDVQITAGNESPLIAINATITDEDGTDQDKGVVTVVNQSGDELPSTGGIGTTIFYVVGSILLVGAGILLVTRKRMSAE